MGELMKSSRALVAVLAFPSLSVVEAGLAWRLDEVGFAQLLVAA